MSITVQYLLHGQQIDCSLSDFHPLVGDKVKLYWITYQVVDREWSPSDNLLKITLAPIP